MKLFLIKSDVLNTAGNLYIVILIGVLSGIIPHVVDNDSVKTTKVNSEIICDSDEPVGKCFTSLEANLITQLDKNNCIEYFVEYTNNGKYKYSASIIVKKRGDI